jgi:hypothetical protein
MRQVQYGILYTCLQGNKIMINSSFSIPFSVADKIIPITIIASTALATIFSSPVFAFSLNFYGGTLELSDFSTGGLLTLVSAQNNSGSIVNDIHLSFSYLDDDGNVVVPLNRTIDRSFGNVNPGGEYTFPALSLIYNNSAIGNQGLIPDQNNLKLSGYWTKDGVPVPVPEPFTIVGTLISGVAAFKMRKKLKAIVD